PTRKLPTLTTGFVNRCCREGSRAYHRRRHEVAAPYTELSTLKINEPIGRGERHRRIPPAAASPRSPPESCLWHRDWPRRGRAPRRLGARGPPGRLPTSAVPRRARFQSAPE